MTRYSVHYGYNTQYLDNSEAVDAYINSKLDPHAELKPRLIYRGSCDNNKAVIPSATGEPYEVRVYQYRTLCTEVFYIERR